MSMKKRTILLIGCTHFCQTDALLAIMARRVKKDNDGIVIVTNVANAEEKEIDKLQLREPIHITALPHLDEPFSYLNKKPSIRERENQKKTWQKRKIKW